MLTADIYFNIAIMDTPQEAKYGFTRSQLSEGFKILINKGVKHFGLHAFLASNTVTNEYYPVLARMLFETAVELNKETGAHIAFVNLSGGIGIPYHPEQQPVDIYDIGQKVKKAFEEILIPAVLCQLQYIKNTHIRNISVWMPVRRT